MYGWCDRYGLEYVMCTVHGPMDAVYNIWCGQIPAQSGRLAVGISWVIGMQDGVLNQEHLSFRLQTFNFAIN